MGSIMPLLCTILGSIITIVLLMAAVRHGVRQISVTSAYREVSRQLGMSIDTRGTSIHGHLGDHRLWLGQVMVGQGKERKEVHWGVLDLDRPLGMEFLLRRRGMSERIFRRSPQPKLPIGVPNLDRSYEVHSAFPESATQLFNKAVVDRIEELTSKWSDLVINDNAVQVHLSSPPANAKSVMSLITCMVELAHAIDERRATLEAPGPLAKWVSSWQALAKEKQLDFEPSIPAISGSLNQRRVLIVPRTPSDNETHSELKLFFRPHPKTGMRLMPQGVESNVGQDILVGAAVFDDAFIVKGYDPVTVRERLNETVRASIMQLCETVQADLELDDRCILIRKMPMDADILHTALTQAEKIANELRW